MCKHRLTSLPSAAKDSMCGVPIVEPDEGSVIDTACNWVSAGQEPGLEPFVVCIDVRREPSPRHCSTMEIINKTTKPISVPLPGGKKLFLGPKKTGQVSTAALTFSAIVKLLESGDIETTGSSSKSAKSGTNSPNIGTGSRNAGTGAMRQSGDR